MKSKIKYIVSALMAISLSALFLPILKITGFKTALFDIVKIGLGGYPEGSIEQLFMSELQSDMEIYAYIIIVFAIIMLFHTVMVSVLSHKIAYFYGIISEIFMNVIVFVMYAIVKEAFADLGRALSFFGINFFEVGKGPAIVWLLCSFASIALCVVGIVLKDNKKVTNRTQVISPEEFYQDKNPWQNKGAASIPSYKHEVTTGFCGGIKGTTGMFAGKIYLLEELVQAYFVKQGSMLFIMNKEQVDTNLRNRVIDEVIAEIYYVPQYEEYVLRPKKRMEIFLASGQPLGSNRDYYLPRATEIYCGEPDQKFILA